MSSDATLMPVRVQETRVWDVPGQVWAALMQPTISTDTINVSSDLPAGAATQATLAAIDLSTVKIELIPVSGSVAGSGNNTIITPTSGKKLRLSYVSYNPTGGEVEVAFRFGASGPLFFRNNMPVKGIWAKDIGDMRYVEGAINESLILNLGAAVTTLWNVLYVEV